MNLIQTSNDKFKLRFAEKKDISLIIWFIKELAAYEGDLQEVVATEEILTHSLFEIKGAEVILAEYEGKAVGFALFHQNFSTFLGIPGIHLEDLYIIPEARGNGFGKIILSYLANLVVERDLGRLEWWCHIWNESAIRFYRSVGAFSLEELKIYRLCGYALDAFAKSYNS